MELATFEVLLTPRGRELLELVRAAAPTQTKYPALVDRFRKHFPDAHVRAALDITLLRERARAKFSRAEELFFTRETLEMATSETVACHRAARYSPYTEVVDLCSGAGADAIGLSLAGKRVTSVDIHPLHTAFTRENVRVYGGRVDLETVDVTTRDWSHFPAAFADPGRRSGERRTLSLHEGLPPLPALLKQVGSIPFLVKLAPGIDRDELQTFDADPEYVSLSGELKECTLAFGNFRTGKVRATVLPGSHFLEGTGRARPPVGPVLDYLYDPDPAITRAGLVAELAEQLSAAAIDYDVPILTGSQRIDTPLASVYHVEETLPFDVRKVGIRLRERGIGHVTIFKRASRADADEVLKKWKLSGRESRSVILTRALGKSVAIIAERLEPERRTGTLS